MFDWLTDALQYINIMRWVVVALALIMAVLSFHKAWVKRDLTICAIGISRLFMGGLYLYVIYLPYIPEEMRVLITASIVFLLSTDFVSDLVAYLTRSYTAEMEVQKTKLALARLEAKNHFILEESPAGIYQYSCLTQKFIYVNPAFARMFDLTPADMIGMSIFSGMSDKQAKAVKTSIMERVSGKADVVAQTIHITTTSGEKRILGCTGKVVYNGEASVLGYAVVLP